MARWRKRTVASAVSLENVLVLSVPALNADDMLRLRFRSFMASARVAKLAQKRYRKCLEESTGATYYFNIKTGESLLPTSKTSKKKPLSFLYFCPYRRRYRRR